MTKTSPLRASILAALVTVWAPIGARSQAPAPGPAFEVASVKPNKSGELVGSIGGRPGGQVVVTNNTLRNIVRNAYQLQNFQIVGGPEWFDTERFDITAKAVDSNPTQQEFQSMVQRLLADRFKLVVHRETRQSPIYALVLARSDGTRGPKLTPSTTDCLALAAAAARGATPPPAPPNPNGRPLCGTRTLPGRILAGGVTMDDLARNVSNFAGRMTLNRTGLQGRFDLELEFTPDQLPPEGTLPPGLPKPPVDGPSLFTAMQEQLGLKLDSQRGPVDVLVIDAADRPTPD